MTRALSIALLLLAAGPLLQGSVLSRAAPGGVTVDLPLVAALAVSATYGTPCGSLAGLAAGFVMDAACGGGGLMIIAYVTAAITAGMLAEGGRGAGLVSGFTCAALAAAVCVALVSAGLWRRGMPSPDAQHAALWVSYEALLTVAVRRCMASPREPSLVNPHA